jgi:hypothetical protein
LQKYTIETTLELVKWIQIKNHRAYLSHRRKIMAIKNHISL